MSTRMAGLRQGDGCVSFTSLQSFHRGSGSGYLPEASMYACNSKAAGWGLKSQKQTPHTFKINLSQLPYLNYAAILGRACPDQTCAERLPRQVLFWSFGPLEVNLWWLYPGEGRAHPPPASPLIHCTASSLWLSPHLVVPAVPSEPRVFWAWLGWQVRPRNQRWAAQWVRPRSSKVREGVAEGATVPPGAILRNLSFLPGVKGRF